MDSFAIVKIKFTLYPSLGVVLRPQIIFDSVYLMAEVDGVFMWRVMFLNKKKHDILVYLLEKVKSFTQCLLFV